MEHSEKDVNMVRSQIEYCNKEILKCCDKLESAGNKHAEAIAKYDCAIGITEIELRNGVEIEHKGRKVKDPPVTLIRDIAKSINWELKLEQERADKYYKSVTSKIDSYKAILNANQSIYRHLE